MSLGIGLAAGAAAPRPELPNPQFSRPQWTSLNGPWEFEFDDADAGIKEDWAAGTRKFSRSITVPFCFESKLSGIGDTSFHPVVWYRRQFTLAKEWTGKNILLHFGAVDYQARVWINGRFAGEHEGGNTPFRVDITPFLKTGANAITLRAWDPPADRSIPRGKQYWEPKSRGIFYTRTSGIWQSVWLEATGASRLDFVRIDSDLDGRVTFDGRIAGATEGLDFHYSVKWQGRVVAVGSAPARGKYAAAGTWIREPRLWSLDQPNLYEVELELRKGEAVIDHVDSYFGIRKVAVERGRVTLNGRPIYLKLVLDQGYWPESLLTPPSDEAIQYDLRMTKEMGFNGARKHQKVEDPRFLYWADKMGLIVSGEMANAYLFDEQYAARFTREWMECLERDINHPSILIWAPINESWGVPKLTDVRQQAHLRSLYHLTRTFDPTRLVIDNEGWEHLETTDLFAVHDYAPTLDALMNRWKVFVEKKEMPALGHPYLIPGYAYNGTPLYLSEFGGIAYIPPGTAAAENAWGYSGVEKTPEAALSRLSGQYNAIQSLPFVGICYTQLTDVEQEMNGLMTYDRKPKFDSKKLKEFNDRLR